jgi:hypothetical protein
MIPSLLLDVNYLLLPFEYILLCIYIKIRAPTRHLYVFKDETVGPVDSTPDEHTSRASSPSRRSSLKISIFQRHIPFLQAVSGSGVHLQQTGTIRDALLRPL